MLGWSDPLVLLSLLGLVPWLRWLHRTRESEAMLRVPAVFLWRGVEADVAGRRSRGRPDPRWRLRAWIAALVVIALAGPAREYETVAIDVYLDDSPTLGVREADGRRRLETALSLLAAALAASQATEIRVISLTRPGRVLALTSPQSDPVGADSALREWATLSERSAPLPGAAELRPGVARWLVSDGVRPDVVAWAKAIDWQRTLQVGRATENAGVVHLGVRRSALAQGSLRGIVRVANGGPEPAERRLVVRRADATLLEEPLEIAPGAVAQTSFSFPVAGPASLVARILPEDALASDDALELDLAAAAPAPLALDPACGAFLRAALGAHPGLEVRSAGRVGATAVALRVSCQATRPEPGSPAIWVPAETVRAPAGGPGERLPGAAEALESSFVEATAAGLLRVKVDLTSPEWARDRAYPEFVAALVARALGRDPLGVDLVAGNGRSGEIGPGALLSRARDDAAGVSVRRRDLSALPLALALLLLVVDAARPRSRT